MPSGSTPGTAPGPCAACGREKRWRADRRRATLGYWTCAHRDVGAPRAPRSRGERRTKPATLGPRVVWTQKLRRGRRPVATLAPLSGPTVHLYID